MQAAPLDLNDPEGLEWAIADDPTPHIKWAKQQFEQFQPDQNPKQWVRALWFYLSIEGEREYFEPIDSVDQLSPDRMRSLLEQGVVLAKQNDMTKEYLSFRTDLVEIFYNQSPDGDGKSISPDAVKRQYETLLSEARDLGQKSKEAFIRSSYAFYLRYLGDTNRSLELLLEANRQLMADPSATELERMTLKSDLALAFGFHKQWERAEALHQEVESFCSRAVQRSFCLINMYNHAKILVDQDDEQAVLRSEAYFLNCLKIALETKHIWMLANIYSGLVSFHNKVGKFDLALQETKLAIPIYQKIEDNVRLTNSYLKGAVAYIGSKRFHEALNYIKLAHGSCTPDTCVFQNDLDELSYKAYRGLGDAEKALHFLEKHNFAFKKISLDREKSDYSRLMVAMGLQIEEEKNKVLSKDNEIKRHELREVENIRLFMLGMLGLSILVIGSMSFAVIRAREVKVSRLKMQRILDNIEEGILTINSNLMVESEYSKYLHVLFRTNDDIAGQDGLKLLLADSTLTSDDKSMIEESIRVSMGEDEVQWSLNAHNLPVEIIYANGSVHRIVAIHWQPLYNSGGKIQSILIGLLDVTERRQLEVSISVERQRSDRLGERIRELAQADDARVDRLLDQAKSLAGRLSEIHSKTFEKPVFLRELHTVKGLARTLGLKELSSKSHELEDFFRSGSISNDSIQLSFRQVVEDYQTTAMQFLRRGNQKTPVAKSQFAHIVSGLIPDLVDHLRKSGFELSGLSIVDQVMTWSSDQLFAIEQILVHALMNSADHGFILPKQEGKNSNSPYFSIEAKRHSQGIALIVRDNGAGLDLIKLSSLAEKMGFIPQEGQTVADVVFLDGSSTSGRVSATSGRGIGMSAILEICRQWGGRAHLLPNPDGSGTQLFAILQEVKQALAS